MKAYLTLFFFLCQLIWAPMAVGGLVFYAPLTDDLTDLVSGVTADFTRNSTKDYWDKDAVFQLAAAADTATFGPNGLRLDPFAVNLNIYARDLSNWTNAGLTPAQDETGIDGVANQAWTIEDDAAGAYESSKYSGMSIVAGATYTASGFIKKDSDNTTFPILSTLIYGGGTNQTVQMMINTSTGASTVNLDTGSNDSGDCINWNADFWYCWVTNTDIDDGNTSIEYVWYPAGGTVWGTPAAAAERAIVVDGSQLEKGNVPTTLIVTSGSATARASERGAVATVDFVQETNLTDVVFSAADGNSFVQTDSFDLSQLAGELASEELTNAGFETAGGGGADIWGTWSENAGTGALANETTVVLAGSDAAKMTAGASADTYVTQTISGLTASTAHRLWFYTAVVSGDNEGNYRVYDNSNSADIIAKTGTGVTSTTYQKTGVGFTTPDGCTEVIVYLYASATNTDVVYFDNVSIKEVTTTPSSYYVKLTDEDGDFIYGYIDVKDEAVSYGYPLLDDDCSADNTADWTKTNCTLAFDADHYEIDRTGADQQIYQAISPVIQQLYLVSIDVKDGTEASVTGNTYLADDSTGTDDVLSDSWTTTASWVSHEVSAIPITGNDTFSIDSNLAGATNWELKNVIIKPYLTGGATGVRVVTAQDGTTEGWTESGTFDYTDTDIDLEVRFVANNGVTWPIASLFGGGGWAAGMPGAYDMDVGGMLYLDWTPGVDKADNDVSGAIVSIEDGATTILYTHTDGALRAFDSTNTVENTTSWSANTTYPVAVSWSKSASALDLYIGGTVDGDGDGYDGAWDVGANLWLAYDYPYPMSVKELKIYNTYSGTGIPASAQWQLYYWE